MQTTVDLISREMSPASNGGEHKHHSDVVTAANGKSIINSTQSNRTDSVPVFVMLPLDTVNADGIFRYASSRWFNSALEELKETGIHGVAVDVWWGAVERRPRKYDWSGYRQLFDLVSSLGLRLQIVLAFHACGGNVGDNAEVPLPPWVMAAGERDPDIFFTDRPRELSPGKRNKECISLFAEEEPGLLKGRSAIQCYVDFMRSFRDEFTSDLGSLIDEVIIGCGPCGELRYPSYPEPNGWRFPGIGEFQCYDRRALASLARAAAAVGHPEWGNAGPHDAGSYNTSPEEVAFFQGWTGRWDSNYGKFFLSWYSNALLEHGERMMMAASSVFNIAKRRSDGSIIDNNGGDNTGGEMVGEDSSGGESPNILSTQSLLEQQQQQQQVYTNGNTTTITNGMMSNGGTTASNNSLDSIPSNNNNDTISGSGGSGNVASMMSPRRLPRRDSPSSSAGHINTNTNATNIYTTNNNTNNNNNNNNNSTIGLPSRPSSYASFRSSSVSEGLNALEDWCWPSPSGPPIQVALKIAGVHWWYRTRSHPAELTAGYHNCEGGSGYAPIVDLCARHGAALTLTCVEMCDSQHPPEALCGPEGLLRQIRETAAAAGVPIAGENALPCFMPNAIDEVALQRVVYNTQPWGTPLQQGGGSCDRLAAVAVDGMDVDEEVYRVNDGSVRGGGAMVGLMTSSSSSSDAILMRNGGHTGSSSGIDIGNNTNTTNTTIITTRNNNSNMQLPPMRAFTFLRLTPEMMSSSYQDQWKRFMKLMARNGQKFRTSPSWRQNMGFQ